jgi:hypothetical protein
MMAVTSRTPLIGCTFLAPPVFLAAAFWAGLLQGFLPVFWRPLLAAFFAAFVAYTPSPLVTMADVAWLRCGN